MAISLLQQLFRGQNSALFTFDMLSNTPTGDTCPITVTLWLSKSMLKDVTPAHSTKYISEKNIKVKLEFSKRHFNYASIL